LPDRLNKLKEQTPPSGIFGNLWYVACFWG